VKRRVRPAEHFPPHLQDFAPADWVDRYHWAMARWEWWREHPGLHDVVDPLELLRERREARIYGDAA
jgi:hypothetical protein